MKISGYHKSIGDNVKLLLDYKDIDIYDKVYISKVFTDTEVPGEPEDKTNKNSENISEWYKDNEFLKQPNIEYGGTGFYYDKAPELPYDIEHHMPDYHLYDEWVLSKLESGEKRNDYKYYLDYSIGFLTRGCFRQCAFCVNKNYKKVELHSLLSEFIDNSRKKICLLDDNFLGHKDWLEMLNALKSTGKGFQFKQGLDERILTDKKCEALFNCKYDGDFIFAFDDVADYDLIEQKLKLIRKYTNKVIKFYTFCGFDRNGKWGNDFWKQDLWDLWERIELLMKYQCIPYIMRFNRYEESPYRGTYVDLANWCNLPSLFKKKSFHEFITYLQSRRIKECASVKYLKKVTKDMPELVHRYYDIKFSDYEVKT